MPTCNRISPVNAGHGSPSESLTTPNVGSMKSMAGSSNSASSPISRRMIAAGWTSVNIHSELVRTAST
jgi:hypothetical protein